MASGAGSVWNSGSWHWEEKKYTPWAHEYLREALLGVEVSGEGVSVRLTKVMDLKGDAALNIRKGKKITVYEVSFMVQFEGRATDGSSDAVIEGDVKVTEVMPDDLDDFEVKISVYADTPLHNKVKELMRIQGTKALRGLMAKFTEELKAQDGGEKALEADKRRREAEKTKADEAKETEGEKRERLAEEGRKAEAKRKEEEAKRAAEAPKPIPADKSVAAEGSVWNKGSYHWEEKPLTEWAHEHLTKLLSKIDIDFPGGVVKIAKVETIKGDASSTVRKGKKIIFYDLTIDALWEGTLFDAEGEAKTTGDGEIKIMEVDQDTDEDDVNVKLTTEGTAGDEALKEKMHKYGVPEVRKALMQFKKDVLAK